MSPASLAALLQGDARVEGPSSAGKPEPGDAREWELVHFWLDRGRTRVLTTAVAHARGFLHAPVSLLQLALRLPSAGRASNVRGNALEVPWAMIPKLVPKLLARPAERAELDSRLTGLCRAFEADLMFAMSRSAQGLFHSNTVAWLAEHVPGATAAFLRLFGSELALGGNAKIWRDYHHLDLLLDPGDLHPKVVVENKLFFTARPRATAALLRDATPMVGHPR